MKRKQFWKRMMTGVIAGSMVISAIGQAKMAQAAEITNLAGEISVNPQIHYQTLKGWGSSMCWWGNIIGSWGDKDFNGNGRPDREEIAELAFSPDYLNLNIVRYNVGGGDKPDTTIKRIEGLVPGWTVDMTGKEDGTGTFNADAFYAKTTEQMNDAGQLWMLEQANQYRKDKGDIVNEVFSNSPPYYMTKSGSSTGGDGGASNLKEDKYDEFALYMARAAKWIDQNLKKKFNTGVDFIEPINEPDPTTRYWQNGSTKQEGCAFAQGEEQSKIVKSMDAALKQEGLADIEITAADETDLGRAITSFQKLDKDAKNAMTVIGAHTYGGDDNQRVQLRKLAASYDKDLWMSEVCMGGYDGHDPYTMEKVNAKSLSHGIMADLKYMQTSAWIAWLVGDSEYECLKHGENWGLLHCVFEADGPVPGYHDNLLNSDGTVKEGVPGAGYWEITKQFYTMMQYSKYLKTGYIMVDIGDDSMCAALSPDGKELVIVAQNFGAKRVTSVDLRKFKKAQKAVCYQTSDEKNCEKISEQEITENGILNVTLPSNSVSTYVVSVETDMENYMKTVEGDIKKPTESGVTVSDLNKFTYTGTWSGQSTTEAGAQASFTFTGTKALIYGTKAADGAKISVTVDGKDEKQVDLSSEKTMDAAVIYDTGTLADGTHTIAMKVAEGQTQKKFAISKADVIHGTLKEESGTVVRKIIPFAGAMVVHFDPVIGASGYTVKYGTSKDNLSQSISVSENTAVIKNVENDKPYYIQVEDSLGGKSDVVSGMAGVQDEDILYFVNVGTQSLSTTAFDETFGSCNSILDQAYGEDSITGKNWGYVGDTNAPAYRDGDRWTSIRYSKEMKPLEYRFDVPSGKYNVTVAMLDPWKNGSRKTDLLINGEKKGSELVPTSKISRIYQVSMEADGVLSVTAKPSSGNTSQDAILSFIKITKADDNAISEAKAEMIATAQGVVPKLPDKIKVVNAAGVETEAAVTWNPISAKDFDVDENQIVKINGVLNGTDMEISQKVWIVPANLQYFIDCHVPDSAEYGAYASQYALLNDRADQAYTEGSWGYLDEYGTCDGENSYEAGWYAKKDQSIQYKLPLKAGSYQIGFGFHEWWNQNRPMKMSAVYDGKTEDLGTYTIDGYNSRTYWAGLVLDKDTDVTFVVEKDNGPDPVLSFLQVTKGGLSMKSLKKGAELCRQALLSDQITEAERGEINAVLKEALDIIYSMNADQDKANAAVSKLKKALKLDADLQKAIEDAKNAKESDYTAASYAAMKIVLDEAEALYLWEIITQEASQAKIKQLGETLVTLASVLEAAIAEYTVQDGAGKYTEESYSAYEAAYQSAKTMQQAGGYTEEKMNAAISELSNAYKALKPDTGDDIRSISLNAKTLKLGQKETFALKASIKSSSAAKPKLQWSSSKDSVAKVSSSGKITAQKTGTAVITVKASNGKKADCKVTVMKAPNKVAVKTRRVKLSKGKKHKITVILPKNTASNKMTFTSDNKKVAVVSESGVVSGKKSGLAVITVKTFNGKKATVKVTVK